jgi:excinuclease ABC subunit C
VLYVGKAQSLRARVRSYFNKGGDGRYQVPFLIARVADVEVVATANVKEALLLENALIKKHKPRFNVRLRDDKNYLALRLDPREAHPRLTETRRFATARCTSPTRRHQPARTLGSLQRIFPLRTCADPVRSYRRQAGRARALGRALRRAVLRPDLRRGVWGFAGATLLLRGKAGDLLGELRERMNEAAGGERFEEAARLRDRVRAIERTVESQAMVSRKFVDRDVFGLAREGPRLEFQVLHSRQGRMSGGNAYASRDVAGDDAEALGSFLAQFYAAEREIPREVLVPVALGQARARSRAGRTRGPRSRWRCRFAASGGACSSWPRTTEPRWPTRLPQPPALVLELAPTPRIEAAAHVSATTSRTRGGRSGSRRAVFVDGLPHKDAYRRSPARDRTGRRLRRHARGAAASAQLDRDPPPDLLLLDGGKASSTPRGRCSRTSASRASRWPRSPRSATSSRARRACCAMADRSARSCSCRE